MPRAATGQVVARDRKAGRVYALRFRAYGERQYITLGTDAEGWSQQRAEVELQNVLADVRRGVWRAPAPDPVPEVTRDPTFHEFASEWWAGKRAEVAVKTQVDYEWQLSNHLLPFFAKHRLSQITVEEVDRYRRFKVEERERRTKAIARAVEEPDSKRREAKVAAAKELPGIGAASVNKTLTRLGQILDVADEYGLITRNPLRVNPKNRKLKASRPAAVWLDRADQIESLLAAAGQLDDQALPHHRHIARRAMLATLVLAGVRLGEMLALRWRDVDLANERLWIADAKTDAGVRHVALFPALREILITHKLDCADTRPGALVFATRSGKRLSGDNVRNRTFAAAVRLADETRTADGLSPLPEGLTPHKLRHTCCSLLFVCGYELPRVMAMLGHSDSSTTLRIYGHVMSAEEGDRDRLRGLVGGTDWAPMGATLAGASSEPIRASRSRTRKAPH